MTILPRLTAWALALVAAGSIANATEPAEPLLQKLPPGVFLKSSSAVPVPQAQAIGEKLGGKVERVTNSVLQMHGRPLQINVITAADDGSAEAIHASLLKTAAEPFVLRNGKTVIEYARKFNIDDAVARKASWELGFIKKPDKVRYKIAAELATIDKVNDYMACNPLFNAFLALNGPEKQMAERKIETLRGRFEFGNVWRLRMGFADSRSSYTLSPILDGTPAGTPKRNGIPFVTLQLEVRVDDTGLRGDPPKPRLTRATPFWPVDDPKVQVLAADITKADATVDGKIRAILEWLTPGKNIQYSGQTGSRWGTQKVLDQKFGHCWDFSDCFVTLARAAGIPARQVAGWLYGGSGHVWAEYYSSEQKGWQQVDPTGGGQLKCGIYHIAYFATDDGEMPIVYLSMPKIEIVPESAP